MHVRLEFDYEKLHDLQMPIRCGEVEWCRTVIIPVIHVRLEFDHEKLHDLQMSRICGSVECVQPSLFLAFTSALNSQEH